MAKSGVAMDLPESASDTFTAQLQPGDIVVLYVCQASYPKVHAQDQPLTLPDRRLIR